MELAFIQEHNINKHIDAASTIDLCGWLRFHMAFIERNVSSDGRRVMTLQQFKEWLKTSFDANGDGRISKDELREVLRITGGLFASWKSNKVLKSVDDNRDGFIDDNEFINLAHFVEKNLNIRIIK